MRRGQRNLISIYTSLHRTTVQDLIRWPDVHQALVTFLLRYLGIEEEVTRETKGFRSNGAVIRKMRQHFGIRFIDEKGDDEPVVIPDENDIDRARERMQSLSLLWLNTIAEASTRAD